ncbi:AAA family ATPase [Rhizobium leguminosarum]|nr:AAA family ATPase [Rhizobium leguminosarum]MBY5433982.1 AAA family ATPase [Rhizobium leguminosarum]NEK45802.1 AAA family ATPase [Rhizobium leguminosarum]
MAVRCSILRAPKPLKVWWVNAEDPQDEINRRFHAAAKHFAVSNEQIGGRLFTDSGRDQEFVIARQEGRDLKIVEPFIANMVAEIRRREIDVVIVDPFVSTHEAQRTTIAPCSVLRQRGSGLPTKQIVALSSSTMSQRTKARSQRTALEAVVRSRIRCEVCASSM